MNRMLLFVKDSIDPKLAARLVAWMKYVMVDRGIDQRELATGLGVDEGHVSKIFKGERQPGFKVFMGLHKEFSVRLEQLVYRDPWEVTGSKSSQKG